MNRPDWWVPMEAVRLLARVWVPPVEAPVSAMRASTRHVVIDSHGQCMRCNHCGEEVPIPLGIARWFSSVGDAFTKAHSRCPKGRRLGDSLVRTGFTTIVPKSKRR